MDGEIHKKSEACLRAGKNSSARERAAYDGKLKLSAHGALTYVHFTSE